MRYWFIAAVVSLPALFWLVRSFDPRETCGVEHFAWTEAGVIARSAQPSIASLVCLGRRGFTAVVNLRDESPSFPEAAVVKSVGMDYLLLAIVDDTAPSPQQVTRYMQFVDDQRKGCGKVLTHDAAGRGRMGVMDGIYLLWQGWSTSQVFERYIQFGAKIDCQNGGHGQIQMLHELGLILGCGHAWPTTKDNYGNSWEHCSRPAYMSGWDYRQAVFPTYAPVQCPTQARGSN
jgi:hypothetical protein